MITIEQIQKLDQKVQAAVNAITALKTENAGLRSKLDDYEKRIKELEVLIDRFKKDQSEIESGIVRALEQLDRLEDSLDNRSETENAPASEEPESEERVPSEAQEGENEIVSPEEDANELDIF